MWMDRSPKPTGSWPRTLFSQRKGKYWIQPVMISSRWWTLSLINPNGTDPWSEWWNDLSVRPLYGFCHQQTKVPRPTHHAGSLSATWGEQPEEVSKQGHAHAHDSFTHTHIYIYASLSLFLSLSLPLRCLMLSNVFGFQPFMEWWPQLQFLICLRRLETETTN